VYRAAVTARACWEKRATKQTLALADELFGWLREIDPALELKYNKFYIGLARTSRPDNFVTFTPKKDWLWFEMRLERDDEAQAKLDAAGLEANYDARSGNYKIRLTKAYIPKQKELVISLMTQAHEDSE
jgi:predicted transport protein